MATKKAAKAPAQKTVTKAPAKKQSKRTRTLRTIKLVTKQNPFDPKRIRHAKWKCLKDGATVSELVVSMRMRDLSSPRTFIHNCAKMGHLQIK